MQFRSSCRRGPSFMACSLCEFPFGRGGCVFFIVVGSKENGCTVGLTRSQSGTRKKAEMSKQTEKTKDRANEGKQGDSVRQRR
jgi:hypothetical protein